MSFRRSSRWLVGSVALIVVGALIHTWIHLRALELGYAIAEESRRLDELLQAERRLRVEVAYLKRPARIEAEARRLGMRVPDPRTLFQVRLPDAASDEGNQR